MSDISPKGFSLSSWPINLLILIGIPMRLKSLIGYIMPKKKFRLRENAHYKGKGESVSQYLPLQHNSVFAVRPAHPNAYNTSQTSKTLYVIAV
jgi:hypothetical protein